MRLIVRREDGVAMVLVLAIVALVSAWAVEAARSDWLALRRIENMQLSTQASLAAESGLAWGRALLAADGRRNTVDSKQEAWAKPVSETMEDGAEIKLSIVDANRFFNLNDLVDGYGRARPEAVAIARRLFARVDVPPKLVDAVVDWIDTDHAPYGSGGNESDAADGTYRIKNAPLDRIEELSLIPGFDAAAIARLRRVAVVRPTHGHITPLNINTAPADVLRSLGASIDERDVSALIGQRQTTPFRRVADMTAQMPSFRSLDGAWLAVDSDGFIIRATGRVAKVRWREEMMVERKQGNLHTVYRQREALGG